MRARYPRPGVVGCPSVILRTPASLVGWGRRRNQLKGRPTLSESAQIRPSRGSPEKAKGAIEPFSKRRWARWKGMEGYGPGEIRIRITSAVRYRSSN